jgi:cytoplasmic iron level regulating protein YaaA (DUF328/UPF0246 family)
VLILLPPSETKREGGSALPVDLSRLAWADEQKDARTRVSVALVALAQKPTACAAALKLSPKQLDEVTRNQQLLTSPTMPAIDRFTGVLFDGLDAASLPAAARRFAGKHIAIQSACFGLVGALDQIPAYRLSANTSLPKLKASLKKVWAQAGTAALEHATRDASTNGQFAFILDARSEDYAALAPLPAGANGTYLRVVTHESDGKTRALNHFNKKAKGEFTRALALDGAAVAKIDSVDALIAWGKPHGWNLVTGAPGETNLVIGS